MGGGGQVKFLPLHYRGSEKVLAMLKGGTKSFGAILTQVLEV